MLEFIIINKLKIKIIIIIILIINDCLIFFIFFLHFIRIYLICIKFKDKKT